MSDYTKEEEKIISIFVTNLRMYNGGMLHGEWFDVDGYFFPDSDELKEDFDKLLDRIGCSGPDGAEWFVTDYDGEFGYLAHKEFGEYPGFDGVRELAELSNYIEDMDRIQRLMVKTLCTEHFAVNELTCSVRAVSNGEAIYHGEQTPRGLGIEMSEGYLDLACHAIDKLNDGWASSILKEDTKRVLRDWFDYDAYGMLCIESGTFYELPHGKGYMEFID